MSDRVSKIPAFGDDRAVVQRWLVPHPHDGSRADTYLSEKIGRISREKCRLLIARGDFRRNNLAIKPSTRLYSGDAVSFWRIPPDKKPETNWPIRILHEDANRLVINKPPYLAVHPTALHYYRTITYWLQTRFPEKPPHICHRLDKETSGTLVCSKTAQAESDIKKSFEKNRHRKLYLAIVKGKPTTTNFPVDTPLALQGDRGLVRIKMIADPNGLISHTDFELLHHDAERNRSLLLCKPLTGRQHQIRAHAALAGHPIVGDKLYDMGEIYFDALTTQNENTSDDHLEHPRHALHAFAIQLHGVQEETVIAPLPYDLVTLMPSLSQNEHYSGIIEKLEARLGHALTSPWIDQTPETRT